MPGKENNKYLSSLDSRLSWNEKIPSKLLIAGEFTVLIGGDTLGFPYSHFYGAWRYRERKDERLHDLCNYLIDKGTDFLDLASFSKDIHSGWIFESNIPEGYGLGSSGALSAAILHQYNLDKRESPKTLQARLAWIESFFHGTSSGFDPLISYTASGCLIQRGETQILKTTESIEHKIKSRLFLIDSFTQRNSIVPIDWYYRQLSDPSFKTNVEELKSVNNLFIQSLVSETIEDLTPFFKSISTFQLMHFTPLIASSISTCWMQGVKADTHYFKLCGKGGGGYYFIWLNCALQEFNQQYPTITLIPIC